jgi:glycosyltransferase involved in cell wall biosynthesis
MTRRPSVTVLVPTYNEQEHLQRTLHSIDAQTYDNVVEVLVADGRSTDATRRIAAEFASVRIVDNPDRIQSAGLNRALAEARGDVIVRVDGHCVLADDYVERCVDALEATGAAMVGGGMHPSPSLSRFPITQRAIASAMGSRLGAGPARFHVGATPGWVDTVYLGAYRLADARAVGGYAAEMAVNEDAEFAIRMSGRGGIWFDPSIRSTYTPRATFPSLARQFYRYGKGRAATALRHPGRVRPRQLVAPALVLGLLSGKRRAVGAAYASLVLARAGYECTRDPGGAPALAVALPVMHLSWGIGFLQGLVSPQPARRARR